MPPARPRPSILRVSALLLVSVLACGGGGGSDGGDSSSSSDGTTGVASTTATTSGGSITATGVTVSTTDPIPGDGPCCAARSEVGCSDDPEIAACVCAVDRFCCESVWDAVCGEKVAALGCGVCESSSTTTPTSTTASDESTGVPTGENVGACCAAHVETGCELPSLAECVCASVPACCLDGWSEDCVEAVGDFGCGVCPPAPTTTTTTSTSETTTSDTGTDTGVLPDNTESCCSTHASTGCEYPGIAECVCGPHPECCDTAWDETCVEAVGVLGCGVCPP
jgi:hypothetical protein